MVSSKLRRLLKPILRFAEENGSFRLRSSVQQVRYLMGKPSTARKSHAKARKEEKRAQHAMSTKAIREAVFARAAGLCESLGHHPWGIVDPYYMHGHDRELDHWLGGIGRKRQKQSVETTWVLCGKCHRARTANYPTTAYWNAIFREHCKKYGYPFTPHIEHLPLPARREASTPPPPPVGVPSVQGKEQSHE